MKGENGETVKKFEKLKTNRMIKAFWTLNSELKPETRVTFERLIDATELESIRQKALGMDRVKPSFTALIVKAAAIALAEMPYANRAVIGFPFLKRLVQFNNMDITVAVERNVKGAEEQIVLADTLYEVDKKSIFTITKELQTLACADLDTSKRWRLFYNLLTKFPVFITKWIIQMPRFSAKLWTEHRGNACMVNSPARYGIDLIVVDQIWPLTVSFGCVKERPVAVNGELQVKTTMPLIIFFDRRVMAGAPAARFFHRLANILEHAETELGPQD